MLRFVTLLIFLALVGGSQTYKAFKTSRAYIFNVYGSGYRAQIKKDSLRIFSPYFQRRWNLPDDCDTTNAKTFRDEHLFTVVVPRFINPTLEGGEVPRGTTVRFASDHVCATFDGSEPICGPTTEEKCKHGDILKDFVVHDDEIILKLRTCKANIEPDTVIYHAYDMDVDVIEMPNEEMSIEDYGIYGWFDYLGNERKY
tara:strand:- start:24836 stop:25432 length:597 start_codon:yes stop_codon:yes gene_type:complete